MSGSSETELATADRFDAERYCAANPDVADYVAAGGDARQHFVDHGMAERRRQMTAEAFDRQAKLPELRYAAFKSMLDASAGEGGDFRFAVREDAFPIVYGDTAYDLSMYDRESANCGFGPFVEEVRANPDKLYADIGCGRRDTKEDNCLYLEVYPSVSADLVMAPSTRYPIASNSLDGIGCFAVLEHVDDPWAVVAEFHRMLKPGGKVFIDWPFLQPVHGYPSHFYNATRDGLRRMFEDRFAIDQIDTFPNQTPAHTLHWILSVLLGDLAERAPDTFIKLRDMSVGALAGAPPEDALWRGVVDQLSPETVMALACGNSLIGRKRD